MKFITKKLDFSNQTITEMKINSKKFYNLIKKRRSVRDFKNDEIDFFIFEVSYTPSFFYVIIEIFCIKTHFF